MSAAPKKPIVLLFQRNKSAAKETSKLLSDLGVAPEIFEDPRPMLVRLQQGGVSLCLMDMTPEDSPVILAMVKTIRKILGLSPPIVAIIRKNDQALFDQLVGAGANKNIKKPVKTPDLALRMSEYISTPDIQEALSQVESSPLGDLTLPQIVDWFGEKVSPLLTGMNDCLETYDDVENQYKYYALKLKNHRDSFIPMVNAMRKSEDKIDIIQALRLYGLVNSRMLVVGLKLSEVTKSNVLGWNSKTGQLTMDPKKLLVYASRTLEHFGEDGPYRDIAFNAGLVLDVTAFLLDSAADRKVGLKKFLDTQYGKAITKCDKALNMAKSLKDLALAKHIITISMIKGAGQALMAFYYKDYLDLLTRIDKNKVSPVAQQLAEFKQYSITHEILGAVLCQNTPGLSEASKAMLFSSTPSLLKTSKVEHHAYTLAQFYQSQPG